MSVVPSQSGPGSRQPCFLKMIVYLVRHGETNVASSGLYGRNSGVHLNATGKAQAQRVAEYLEEWPVQAIYSSPLERALETAEPLAARKSISVETMDAFNEVDQGDWTGRTWSELHDDPSWRLYNTFRSGTSCPNGEMAVEIQARVVRALHQLLAGSDRHIVIVSHADVIRAAVAFYAGIPLDLSLRVEISLGSVSTLEVRPDGARIIELNRAP
jgi:broad specificity phosphatase PhoE